MTGKTRSFSSKRYRRQPEWQQRLDDFFRSDGGVDKGEIALKRSVGIPLTRPEALSWMWITLSIDFSKGYSHSSIYRDWLDGFRRVTGRPFPKGMIEPVHKAIELKEYRISKRPPDVGPPPTTQMRAARILAVFKAMLGWLNLPDTTVEFDKSKEDAILFDRKVNKVVVPRNFYAMFRTTEMIDSRFVETPTFLAPPLKCLLLNHDCETIAGFKTTLAIMPGHGSVERVMLARPIDLYEAIMDGRLRMKLPKGTLDGLRTRNSRIMAIPTHGIFGR